MRFTLMVSGMATAVVVAGMAPGAMAQDVSKFVCQAVGLNGAPEPLGDREGHGISVTTESCRNTGGPMDGGLTSGQSIWEWDGPNAKMLLESGVVRKPGAIATYEITEGNLALTMTDGKVTGFTASGKGRWPTASAAAAALAGRSWSFKARSTGAGQWEGEVTADVAAKIQGRSPGSYGVLFVKPLFHHLVFSPCWKEIAEGWSCWS